MVRRLLFASIFVSLALACSAPTADLTGASKPVNSRLKPSSALQTDCFGWPKRAFNKKNHAEVSTILSTGDEAVDFTLLDTNGEPHTLSELLVKGPVLLTQGSYTCPRYQDNKRGINNLATKYEGQLQVVTVYNIEAHPAGVRSPYRGKPWPLAFSDRGQATTYSERVSNARDIEDNNDTLVLVDSVGKRGTNNPIWCTYGNCPSCSFLIEPSGEIVAVHKWHDTPTMDDSIEAMFDSL